jgi:hypothetical protein
MAIHPISLNMADIQMAAEMFDASPDGAKQRARFLRIVEELPDAKIEISGHWCDPD